MSNKNNKLTKPNQTLTPEQSDLITKHAALQAMVDTRKDALIISSIDYNRERETFIAQHNSRKTKEQYNYGLTKLEDYCEKQGISVLDIKPALADDFIIEIKQPKYKLSSATVRVVVASLSAFFTFVERRHPVIKNPFRGTKCRPQTKALKSIGVPTKKDIDTLIKNVPNDAVRAAIIFMCETGIRAGGLDTLTIKSNKYCGVYVYHLNFVSTHQDIHGTNLFGILLLNEQIRWSFIKPSLFNFLSSFLKREVPISNF